MSEANLRIIFDQDTGECLGVRILIHGSRILFADGEGISVEGDDMVIPWTEINEHLPLLKALEA